MYLPRVYLCVPKASYNKQQCFPLFLTINRLIFLMGIHQVLREVGTEYIYNEVQFMSSKTKILRDEAHIFKIW
jgi:uncharacterized membrane protein YjdF